VAVDAGTRRKKALDWLDRLEIGEFAERDYQQPFWRPKTARCIGPLTGDRAKNSIT
jgi:hypothetical protein